ncbi:DUF6473 family protein [Pseudooceanicola sp. LIPI14-2-Ac024]|uniref:DUF6473 family protein n=1 Tax=Pseudooceanicola sp. LIPI14-2-Ac024 TaxID=3344875 RepID=UPI0035CFB731
MTYEKQGAAALDYFPCRYAGSKHSFRGPRSQLDGDYVAFLGGTDTYGRFIPRPFPALVGDRLGLTCANLGWMNAGADAFLNDPGVLAAARGARAVVLQVPGAQNMSNRYYAVHPRRNDRFVEASFLMRRVFPGTDFTEFHFTRHLLSTLAQDAPERFAILVAELQFAWVARISELIRQIERPVLLLWFADHAPRDASGMDHVGADPLFVTPEMIAALKPAPVEVIDATVSPAALARGTEGMVFSEIEAPAASEVMGPAAHAEAAERIIAHLADVLALQG